MRDEESDRGFQSTRSQRPRQTRQDTRSQRWNFNPRGRKDLDVKHHFVGSGVNYFNPRGRKDLDSYRALQNRKDWYFNPRGRKDLDIKIRDCSFGNFISIHEVAKTSTLHGW